MFLYIDARLLTITQQAFASPPVEESLEVESIPVVEVEVEAEAVIAPIPTTASGGIQFMQVSEIESSNFEEDAEWVEKSDVVAHEEDVPTNGHAHEAPPAEVCHDFLLFFFY